MSDTNEPNPDSPNPDSPNGPIDAASSAGSGEFEMRSPSHDELMAAMEAAEAARIARGEGDVEPPRPKQPIDPKLAIPEPDERTGIAPRYTPTPELAIAVAPILDWIRAINIKPSRMKVDSRIVEEGNIFIAMPGITAGRSEDGRSYIDKAIERGAAALIVEAQGWPQDFPTQAEAAASAGIPVLPVQGVRALSGHLASRYYDWPSRKIATFAVTGTNGKTSTAHWIAHGLSMGDIRCGVLGTVGCGFPGGGPMWSSRLTTPEAVPLQSEVCQLIYRKAKAVALEASSIGLDQGRLDSMHIDVAVFTNLTRDHLDYHGTMQAYEEAKTKLFDWPDLQYAVINLDDPMGGRLVERLRERVRKGPLKIFGTTMARHDSAEPLPPLDPDIAARFSAHNVRSWEEGMIFDLRLEKHGQSDEQIEVRVHLVGLFNITNLMSAFAAWHSVGARMFDMANCAKHLEPPHGRMQFFSAEGTPLVVVDYAHTPDALEQAVKSLVPLARARKGKLWVMFGCGGDRDQGKRPMMGRAALAADRIVITNDNPRFEDPRAIIDAIAAGVPAARFADDSCECIPERDRAIERVTLDSDVADVVLLAGKGHEDYQDVEGVRYQHTDIGYAKHAVRVRNYNWRLERGLVPPLVPPPPDEPEPQSEPGVEPDDQ